MLKIARIYRSSECTEEILLSLSASHYYSARFLCQHPLCFFSAGYLTHLSLELILKAIILSKQDSFPKIHKLINLIKEIPLALDPTSKKYIEELDSLYKLRYTYGETGTTLIDHQFQTLKENFFKNFPELDKDWKKKLKEIKLDTKKIPKDFFVDLKSQYCPFEDS